MAPAKGRRGARRRERRKAGNREEQLHVNAHIGSSVSLGSGFVMRIPRGRIGTSLHVTFRRGAYPPQFDESVQKGKILSNKILSSPTPRTSSNYQKEYILWDIRYDETVPICFSPKGRERVKEELLSVGTELDKSAAAAMPGGGK